MAILDYRDPAKPVITCPLCNGVHPVPLPIGIPALSALIRDFQFRHAACHIRARRARPLSDTTTVPETIP